MRLTLGVVIVTVLSMTGGVSAETPAGASVGEGPPFPRIVCVHGVVFNPDGDQAAYASGEPATLDELARYDLILGVCGPWVERENGPRLREKIAMLKRRNPDLIVVSQEVPILSSYADLDAAPAWASWPGRPADPWLREVDGTRVPWVLAGQFMLDLTKPAVVEWLAQCCADIVRKRGYDGTILGQTGATMPKYGLNQFASQKGRPAEIDIDRDGEVDVTDEVANHLADAREGLCARTRGLVGRDAVLMGAGTPADERMFNYINGWASGSPLLHFARGTLDWKSFLEDYLHWTETPHRPNTTVMISVPDAALGTEGRTAQLARMRFGLAATLMGDGYYGFTVSGKRDRWSPEFDTPLGYPRGPAQARDDGTWQREFDNGVAIVNPTAEAVRVEMRGEYRNVSTGAHATSFEVPALDGRILVPAGQSPVGAGLR